MKRQAGMAALGTMALGTIVGTLVLGSPVMAGEGINVKAGGSHVQISGDGTVKVKMPGSMVNVGGGGVSADVESAQPLSNGRTFDGANQTWKATCDASKTQIVTVNGTENSVTVTGSCKSVTINGTGNKVTLEYAGAVTVGGTENKVTIVNTGAITVGGTENNITYKMGLDGKAPKISNSGTDNTVLKSK